MEEPPAGDELGADIGMERYGHPFRTRLIQLPRGKMHYVDQGQGETLLMIHGTPTWSFEWRHLIEAFSPDHRCVAPDHLGFGYSERPAEIPYTPEAHAENLSAFVEKLDLRNITLVVHDFGGPIGLPLCLEKTGRVKRLVVFNSWMWSFAGDKQMQKQARLAGSGLGRFLYRRANFSLRVLLPYAYGDKRRLTPEVHQRYLDRFPGAWSRGAVLWPLAKALLASGEFYDSLWRERSRLGNLPALIVWGLKDRAFPPAYLDRWREALPKAQVKTLAEAGHWPHEEAPETVIAAIREFLG